jgi:hypothetical protein
MKFASFLLPFNEPTCKLILYVFPAPATLGLNVGSFIFGKFLTRLRVISIAFKKLEVSDLFKINSFSCANKYLPPEKEPVSLMLI